MLDTITFEEFGNNDFHMDLDTITFKKLMVFIGTNNIGKSFIFKTAWLMTQALNIYQVLLSLEVSDSDKLFQSEFNNMFRWTFTESDQLNGAVKITAQDILEFTINMKNGKLDNFNLNITDPKKFKEVGITPVTYNSTQARLFSEYDKYIAFKKAMNIAELNTESLNELSAFYRLYDIMWFEELLDFAAQLEEEPNLIKNIIDPIKASQSVDDLYNEVPGLRDGDNIIAKGGTFYVADTNGSETKFSSLGNGVQSTLMMTLGSIKNM